MKLICKACKREHDYQKLNIRAIPVDGADDEMFQTIDPDSQKMDYVHFKCSFCRNGHAETQGEPTGPWPSGAMVMTKVFDDPTPKGQINGRIIFTPQTFFEFTNLTEKEKEALFNILVLCGKKLVAVWKHLKTYTDLEDQLIKKAENGPPQGHQGQVTLEMAQDLFIEFDEFLVQLKSSLDYLVKVPTPILGRNLWNLPTFGEKGEKVVQALENNLPKEKKKAGKFIIEMVIRKSQPWLEDVIKARDRVNHCIGDPIELDNFMVFKYVALNGTEMIKKPLWSPQQTVSDAMPLIWDNLIRFFEDFIISFLYMRFKPELCLFKGTSQTGSNRSPWQVTTVEARDRVVSQAGWTKMGL